MESRKYIELAQDYVKKGDKAMKGTFFGNLMDSKDIRAEKACEYYKQAAINYKLGQEWEKASETYLKCLQCDQISKNGESAEYLIEAGNMMKKVNVVESIKLYLQACETYCQEGRLVNGAKLQTQIAEIYEQEQEIKLAINYYKKAADLYNAETDYSSNYNKVILKVADLSASQLNDSQSVIESIKIYQQVIDNYLQNKLLAPSARDLFLKTFLLYLANQDSVGANVFFENYQDKDPASVNTREVRFAKGILNSVQNNDQDQFGQECFEFNSVIPLDKFKTNVLTKIKNGMSNAAIDDNEDPFI